MNYERIYSQIVTRAKKEHREKVIPGTPGSRYYEAHHILPKCLGGEGKASQWRWHSNIVLLTAREHFICHWLLYRMYPKDRKLASAFWGMCVCKNKNQKRYIPPSRAYEEAKQVKAVIERQQNTGKEISEETRLKIAASMKGKNVGKEKSKEVESRRRKTCEEKGVWKANAQRMRGSTRLRSSVEKAAATQRQAVLHVATNIKYPSIKDAAIAFSVAPSTICARIGKGIFQKL